MHVYGDCEFSIRAGIFEHCMSRSLRPVYVLAALRHAHVRQTAVAQHLTDDPVKCRIDHFYKHSVLIHHTYFLAVQS